MNKPYQCHYLQAIPQTLLIIGSISVGMLEQKKRKCLSGFMDKIQIQLLYMVPLFLLLRNGNFGDRIIPLITQTQP